MLEGKEIDLNLPVDAYDADGNPRVKPVISEEISTEVSQTEEKKEAEKPEEEEQRVPYSRFSKVRERAEQAEYDAEQARAKLHEVMTRKDSERDSMPSDEYEEQYKKEIVRLYGDTDVAKEIIDINLKHQRSMEQRAEQRALEAIERRETEGARALVQNEGIIDSRLDDLSDRLGRGLSDREEAALLDIVDEYTPTGDDGKYAGDILSFEKAWEIYELRNNQGVQATKRARSAATQASGNRSSGESTASAEERNKDWNPLNWKSLYDRIK